MNTCIYNSALLFPHFCATLLSAKRRRIMKSFQDLEKEYLEATERDKEGILE